MAFKSWWVVVELKKEKSVMINRSISMWRGSLIPKAFTKWKVFHEHQLIKEEKLHVAEQKRGTHLLRTSIHSWKVMLPGFLPPLTPIHSTFTEINLVNSMAKFPFLYKKLFLISVNSELVVNQIN